MQRQRTNLGKVNPEMALDGAARTLEVSPPSLFKTPSLPANCVLISDMRAVQDVKTVGASTACAVTVDTSTPGYTILEGVNIGDSGCVRDVTLQRA
eukprot:2410759-Rhodomonas_salina.1